MAYSNGIIAIPISIADLGAALGSSSKDVATLVGSPLVNYWARLKPVSRNDIFYDRSDIANNDASLAARLEDAVNGDFYQYNFKIPHGTWSTQSSLFDQSFKAILVKAPYPFRMADFKGYKPGEKAPSATLTVSGLYYNMTSEVALSIIEGTGIKVSDFVLKYMDTNSVSATSLGTWKIVFLIFIGSTVLLVNTGQTWNSAISNGSLYKSIGASYLSAYNGSTANIIACLCGDTSIPSDVTILSGSKYSADRFIPLNFNIYSAQKNVKITAFNWLMGIYLSITVNSKPVNQRPYYGVQYFIVRAESLNFDDTQCSFRIVPKIVKSDGTVITGNTFVSSLFTVANCYNSTTKYSFPIKTPTNGNTWVGFTGLIGWNSSYSFLVDVYLNAGTDRGLVYTSNLTDQINKL